MMNEIKEIQNGNKIALEQFLNEHEKYIESIIKKYKNIFDDYEELKQEAIKKFIELLYVVDYNVSKDRFMQYFYARLTISIRRYVFSNLERIKNIEEKYLLCLNEYDKCKSYLKHEPTYQELAKYLTVNRKSAFEILYIVNNFDKLIKNKNVLDSRYNGFEGDILDKLDAKGLENSLVQVLTPKQMNLISSKFGFDNKEPMTFSEIATMYNVSSQCIQSNYEYAKKKIIKNVFNIWHFNDENIKKIISDIISIINNLNKENEDIIEKLDKNYIKENLAKVLTPKQMNVVNSKFYLIDNKLKSFSEIAKYILSQNSQSYSKESEKKLVKKI